jgi:hypothetical protein
MRTQLRTMIIMFHHTGNAASSAKKEKKAFTIQRKSFVSFAMQGKRLENGLSQRAACEELNIHHTLSGL